MQWGTSLVVQWLGLLPVEGVHVWSLVRELRSHMPHGQKKQTIKQYYNKFIKDFKNCSHEKKNLKHTPTKWESKKINSKQIHT